MRKLTLLVFSILLISCQAHSSTLVVATGTSTATHVHTTTSTNLSYLTQPTSTQIVIPKQAALTPIPLQIQFPTPASNPVSIWRAPLYPVPFALTSHDHFLFMRPIPIDEVNWPLADYRYGYIFPNSDAVHTGIDIAVPVNTPILAAGDGKVIWAGYGLLRHNNDPDDPYGMAVAIRHDFGYQGRKLTTVYAHMERVDVEVGQSVKMGDQLGIVGTTGFTTGPHLHFEIRVASTGYFTTRNPELWISPPEGCGLLVGKISDVYGNNLGVFPVTITSSFAQESWNMYTYGPHSINSDEFYKENLVLSDLPQGTYMISLTYKERTYTQKIKVNAGSVSYFTFKGINGFTEGLPKLNTEESWLIPYNP